MSRKTKTERKRQRLAQANQSKWAVAIAIGGPRREPNGRLSRRIEDKAARDEMTEMEAKVVMLEARGRKYNLPPDKLDVVDAGKPNVGTVHGLLCLQGLINRDQFDAAEWFIGKRNAWARAMEAPGEPIASKEAGRFDEEAHQRFCQKAREQWREIVAVIQDASTQSRSPVMAALDHLLVRQIDLGHLHGDLRIGLNALRKAFL